MFVKKKALCARFAVDKARILCYNAAMELIDISADAQKTKTLSKWLKRDFPLSERTPFRILKKLARQGKACFYFACEGGEVKAYCVLHFFGGYTQLLYLAVTPEARGAGVGGAVVPLIKAAAGGTTCGPGIRPLYYNRFGGGWQGAVAPLSQTGRGESK